ncbi:tRNA 2-thiouridine synthesizing protein B [Orbus hercynius]|uniref:tRNA 2-thiouridine synthesizing protein B n=1 Tax=Orbus hercynius TaxID=593135 RepID=A0A495RAH2_9GAMM|nr:sulfurtransferase complex subunit TusB [Orbus hercynius]RKS84487.1 tRNA 2-thiouridine synthesizing protein B [Orbus hercynius]
MLHTIANSTIDIDLINANDAVIFWQNGVILTMNNTPILQAILTKTDHCYALDNDITARGLTSLIDSRVKIVNMDKVVALTACYYPQMKW